MGSNEIKTYINDKLEWRYVGTLSDHFQNGIFKIPSDSIEEILVGLIKSTVES